MIPSIAPEFSRCRLSVGMLPDRPSGMSCPRQKYSSANKLRTPFVDARRVPPSQSRNHDKCLISVIAWRARVVTTADALRGTRSPGSCLNLGGGPPTCGASGSTVSITRRVSPATMDAEPRQDTPLSGPARIRLRALLKGENSETRFPHDRVHASIATPFHLQRPGHHAGRPAILGAVSALRLDAVAVLVSSHVSLAAGLLCV